jgi:hypothetical protein
MQTKEHSVKEWHFTFEALPGQVFKIQADTEEKARRILKGKIAAISREIGTSKEKPNQPTS